MNASSTKPASGMGSLVTEKGVSFRVWAPNAKLVSIVGSFNDRNNQAHPMENEGEGYWYGEIAGAKAGDEYRFFLKNGDFEVTRIDPYAREVTNSVGNAVVCDRNFNWADDHFQLPPINELAVYEMHVGTFGAGKSGRVGTFQAAAEKLDYLQRLGVNVIEIMPVAEFAGGSQLGLQSGALVCRGIELRRSTGAQRVCEGRAQAWHRRVDGRGVQPLWSERSRSMAIRRMARKRQGRHLFL
jgi:1,4-alpha-glucan branching enzyme